MQLQDEYLALLDLLFQIIEAQSNQHIEPGQEWLNDAQVLSIKLYNHLTSIQRLSQGASTNHRGTAQTGYIDHASVQVVSRAALETYLVFFYIYGTTNQSLSQFRYKTWHLAGLTDRQKFGAINEEARLKMAEENEMILRLKAEINQSEHFENFSDSQRKQLLKGHWRVGKSWKDLGEYAGFHGQYFENIYCYFCGYSHSSYASVLQVRDARSRDIQQMLTSAAFGLGLIVMAYFSLTYTRLFPNTNAVMSSNPKASQLARSSQTLQRGGDCFWGFCVWVGDGRGCAGVAGWRRVAAPAAWRVVCPVLCLCCCWDGFGWAAYAAAADNRAWAVWNSLW